MKLPSASLFALRSPDEERAVTVAPATASFLLVTSEPLSVRAPPDCASVWTQESEINISGNGRRFFTGYFLGFNRIAAPRWGATGHYGFGAEADLKRRRQKKQEERSLQPASRRGGAATGSGSCAVGSSVTLEPAGCVASTTS